MKREICVPEVPASQMVLTIITDEQLEAFADAVITKYQQSIARRLSVNVGRPASFLKWSNSTTLKLGL